MYTLHERLRTAPAPASGGLAAATLAGGLLLLAAPAGAQLQEDLPASDPTLAAAVSDTVSGGVGLAERAGGILAGGPDYRAWFEAGSMTFTPALGAAAPTTLPLTFTLEDVRRGDVVHVAADGGTAPVRQGERVVFHHAGGVEERYDVRPEGLHQSFLFPDRPAGAGDLVVRGRITTDLAAVAATRVDEGPLFELPGVGGVRFGTVTGVDADGDTVAGDLRLVGDVLELSLPAAFVDAAAYPLLLDPLIGSELDVNTQTFDDGNPEVAYDATNQTYLMVWQRRFSQTDVAVRGQRMNRFGTLQGGVLFLSQTGVIAVDPVVGNVADSDTFLVVWQQAANVFVPPQIVAQTVTAFGGAQSNVVTIAASANVQLAPAVGGERTTSDDDCVVVWDESGVGIRAAQVTTRADTDPFVVGSPVTLELDTASDSNGRPAISRSGGETGTYLVTWTATDASGDGEIRGMMVSRNLTELTLDVALSGPGGWDEVRSAVDGDGLHFVVAWERSESLNSSDSDIVARAVEYDGVNLAFNSDALLVEGDPGDHEFGPSVAWTGTNAVVAHLDVNSPAIDLYAKILDPFTCETCEQELLVDIDAGEDALAVAVGSQWSGGGTGNLDDALFVWERRIDGESDSDIQAFRYDAEPAPVDLDGRCGAGGYNFNPCAFDGNSAFTAQLRLAAPATTAVFLVSLADGSYPCGACVLVPALDGSQLLYGTTTDLRGGASLSLPLPPGVGGITVYSQWLVRSPGVCGAFPSWSLSNALQTYIVP